METYLSNIKEIIYLRSSMNHRRLPSITIKIVNKDPCGIPYYLRIIRVLLRMIFVLKRDG